jgi:hypothetical protein
MKTELPKAPRELVDILMCVNRCAFRELRCRNSCVLSSHALDYVLRQLGYSSKLLRVTATVFPNTSEPRIPCVKLGGDGDGMRRPKADEGMWHGHVAVLVNNRWLLDPTLDQANNDNIEVGPVAFEMKTLNPRGPLIFLKVNGCDVRYQVYRTQKGFATAPDARPSHWMSVARAALAELQQINMTGPQVKQVTLNALNVPVAA